jgi:hypothetical protein
MFAISLQFEITLKSHQLLHVSALTWQSPESCSLFENRHTALDLKSIYVGWNFNSGNYLFTTDTK